MTEDEKRVEDYRRLIDIARDLASTLELEVLLNRIVRAASDLTNAEAASILLFDEAAGTLYFQVTTNLDKPTMRGLVVPMEGSIAGWIVTNRKPACIVDVKQETRHLFSVEKQTHLATRSLLGVPLVTKDKVVGVLEVINKQDGEFDAYDTDLLQVLGAQAAVAIENARLFQQSDLVAEFIHELRTPLASIGTATYLLLRPEMSREQRLSMIQAIHDETMRLNTLTSTFLDLARLESGRVQFSLSSFDLACMVEDCVQMMKTKADERGISLETQIASDFPPVNADRDKIKQVLVNLLSNAIKYNYDQGSVKIMAAQKDSEWSLSVSDTGQGIPVNAIQHIFQKFYRADTSDGYIDGTGLGLSICKQIVTGHGGTIDVKSKPGKGATFTIHIPRYNH
jgi:signal transduction histidine kinase